MKIVFLDKDGTLGSFGPGSKGLFPKTAEFLSRQKRKERKLFVVTSAPAAGAAHLVDLPLDGYFGSEKVDSSKKSMYILPDGKIRNIHDDWICDRVASYIEANIDEFIECYKEIDLEEK